MNHEATAVLAALALFAASTALAAPAPTAREVVAAVLVAEAGGEPNPRQSMRAVWEVVRNRQVESHGRLTAVEIVLQREQFSCLNGTTPAKLVAAARRHARWAMALRIVDRMPRTNLARGANHYCTVECRPDWVTVGVVPVTRVGNHLFYKL